MGRSRRGQEFPHGVTPSRSGQIIPPDATGQQRLVVSPKFHWLVEHGLAVTFAFAFLIRLLHWYTVHQRDPMYGYALVDMDMHLYWEWAKNIAHGDWLSRKNANGPFYYNPLYAYFLSGIFRVFGERPGAVHGIQAFTGALVPAFVWMTTETLFGRPTALLSGLLASLCVPFIFYDQVLLGENIILLAYAIGLWGVSRTIAAVQSEFGNPPQSEKVPRLKSWQWAALSGVAFGVACTGRGNGLMPTAATTLGIGFLPMAFQFTTVKATRKLTVSQQRALTRRSQSQPEAPDSATTPPTPPRFDLRVQCLILMCAFSLGVFPPLLVVIARNYKVGHQIALTTNAAPLFYIGNAVDATGIFTELPSRQRLISEHGGAQDNVDWWKELRSQIAADPMRFIKTLGVKTWLFINSFDVADNVSFHLYERYFPLVRFNPVQWMVIVPLGFLGIIVAWRSWRAQLPFYVFTVFFAASIIAVFVVGRYRVPFLIPMAIWGGPACLFLIQNFRRRNWSRFAPAICFVAGGGFALAPQWSSAAKFRLPNDPMIYTRLIRSNDYSMMARTFAWAKDTTESLHLLEEGLQMHPISQTLIMQLANEYAHRGELDRAVRTVEASVRKAPNDPRLKMIYASTLWGANRPVEAVDTLEGVVKQYPGFKEAQERLDLYRRSMRPRTVAKAPQTSATR